MIRDAILDVAGRAGFLIWWTRRDARIPARLVSYDLSEVVVEAGDGARTRIPRGDLLTIRRLNGEPLSRSRR